MSLNIEKHLYKIPRQANLTNSLCIFHIKYNASNQLILPNNPITVFYDKKPLAKTQKTAGVL